MTKFVAHVTEDNKVDFIGAASKIGDKTTLVSVIDGMMAVTLLQWEETTEVKELPTRECLFFDSKKLALRAMLVLNREFF